MARDTVSTLDDLSEDIRQREITLSTSTILGIFFALALACATFFGLGYTVGRKSGAAASVTTGPTANTTAMTTGDSNKPSAGSLATQPVSTELPSATTASSDSAAPSQPYSATTTAANSSASPAASASRLPAATSVAQPIAQSSTAMPSAPARPEPVSYPASAAVPTAGAASPSNAYVQIAAVSRQDDADLLLQALRVKGYAVNALQAGDKLIHVQMGPFMSRKDAEVMRQRLLSDGYNAIIK